MIRVLLAEDQLTIRAALVALLNLETDLEVVAQVESGAAAVSAAMSYRPDVAVLDVDMPGDLDGLDAAAVLRDKLPECRVLILTGHGKPGNLRRGLRAQVDGFLLKTAPPDDLVSAICRVAEGERILDPSLAVTAWGLADNPLTPREVEVLRHLAEGADATEIADRVHLTAGTVRNYLTAIVTKLNARNRTDAGRIATEAGWI